MSSLKQVIINAIYKVSGENPALNREDQPSAEEARDMFIAALMAELFPEESVKEEEVVVVVPQTLPERVTERKATKEEKAKAKEEAKAAKEAEKAEKLKAKEEAKAAKAEAKAEKAKAKESAKSTPVASPVKPVEEEQKPVEEESPSGRKKRAPMTEEQKEAMKAKRAATLAAKKAAAAGSGEEPVAAPVAVVAVVSEEKPVEEKKVKKAKKEKPAADANLPKVDPTWRKHLKKADKDHAKELEPELLAYLNAMSKEDFNSKSAEEHIAEFLASRAKPSEDGKVETDLDVVEFNGKEYYVNPETKRVYEGEGVYDEEVGWTNYKPVGYAGMAAFAEMTLDA